MPVPIPISKTAANQEKSWTGMVALVVDHVLTTSGIDNGHDVGFPFDILVDFASDRAGRFEFCTDR